MKPRIWSAFALSALGYEITFFAMTLVVFNRSRNPFDVGLFTALTFAPKLLAPFFAMVSARIGGRTGLSAAFYATLVSLHSLRDRSTSSDFRGVVCGAITAAGVPPAVISMLVGSFMMRTMGIRSVLVACGACATACLVLCVVLVGRWSSNRESAQTCAIPEKS